MDIDILDETDPEIIVRRIITLNYEIDSPRTSSSRRGELQDLRRQLTRLHTTLTSGAPPIGP